ncbi:hypothetical protein [Staphylococcus simulans]|uniref:hypothetical protein n=1 Tax=Staphylococcus simulans TaxID=1286 RepID=UPI000D02EC1F|nr:hypothetical protein [Staphylococcus simulans]
MKLRIFVTTLTATTLLLAGCGNQSNNQAKQDNTKQTQTSNEQTKQDNNQTQSEQNSNKGSHNHQQEKDVSQLSNNEKVALALCEPTDKPIAITANELLNHSYRFLGPGSDEQRPIDSYQLHKADSSQVSDVPNDTTVYVASPSNSNGVTIFAVSTDQVIISGAQSESSYQKLVNEPYAVTYNLKDLYQKYGHNHEFEKVANLIKISEAPRTANNPQPSSEDSNSDSGETVTRDNVIDKVEEYEGHTLDTSTYTYKEPEQMGDGRWGFSILDKSGDLAGSYIVNSDGSVEKYDADGERE